MEYEPNKPANKKTLTAEISVALIGGLAILIAAMISVWGTLTAAQVPISATQTAEAKLTQIALIVLTPATATLAPIRTFTPMFTATPTSLPPNSPTSMATVTPKPSDTLRPTGTSTPKPTGTPSPTVGPTPGIGSTKISLIDGATMMYVPAGDFLMGSSNSDSLAQDDEKPPHTVYLDTFWIDKYEVTNALYKKCVSTGKCQPPNPTKSYTRDIYYGNSQYDNYPVIYVSWDSANTFCNWANKKLPTEAQWEKAASWDDVKKEKRIYPWGNTFDKNLVNSYDGAKGDTTAVGSYPGGASFYGVVDVAGNVWEWIADWYDANYYKNSPSRNPIGPSSGSVRVVRGGSWDSHVSNVRATDRPDHNPDNLNLNLGFRCVE